MSKIGAHVSGHPRQGYADLCRAKPSVVVSLNDGGCLEEAWHLSYAHTVTIFRDTTVYLEAPPDINSPPGTYADMAGYWYPKLRAKWLQNPARFYTITNEQGGNDARALQNLVAYEREIMRRANADGIKVCVLNLATGSPGNINMWQAICHPFVLEAFQAGNIYGRHVYAKDLGSFDGNANRPFQEIERLGDVGGVAITECGLDGGYGYVGDAAFLNEVALYDARVRNLRSLVGFAMWELGATEFRANWQTAIPRVAEYLTTHPTDPWEFIPPTPAPSPSPPPPPAPELPLLKVVNLLGLNVRERPTTASDIVGFLSAMSKLRPTERRIDGDDVWVRWGPLGWSAERYRGRTYLREA